MDLLPDTWYRFDRIRSSTQASNTDATLDARFFGCALTVTSGLTSARRRHYPYLQFALKSVDLHTVHGLPARNELVRLAARDCHAVIGRAAFEYRLEVRSGDRSASADAVVCIALGTARTDMNPDDRRHHDAVEHAARTGLLDDQGHARASFRLQNRARLRRLAAIGDAGFAPAGEWQLDALFAQWRDTATGDDLPSPLTAISDLAGISLRFVASSVRRDFRMTDLFR